MKDKPICPASEHSKMEDHGYLGHFKNPKFMNQGHNECKPGNEAECERIRYMTEEKQKHEAEEKELESASGNPSLKDLIERKLKRRKMQ